jgi:hypothetical protein
MFFNVQASPPWRVKQAGSGRMLQLYPPHPIPESGQSSSPSLIGWRAKRAHRLPLPYWLIPCLPTAIHSEGGKQQNCPAALAFPDPLKKKVITVARLLPIIFIWRGKKFTLSVTDRSQTVSL